MSKSSAILLPVAYQNCGYYKNRNVSPDESMNAQKRKQSVLEKTPVSMLQELCDQENEAIIFEHFPCEANPQMFICELKAFDVIANGLGPSKREAKHKACAKVISQLVEMNRYVGKLSMVPQTSHVTAHGDAIGYLNEICTQRSLPKAKFDVKRTGGAEHCPIFTAVCRVSSIERTGSGSTIKNAKQIAARAVLDVVQNDFKNESQPQPVPVPDSPKKLFRLYREHRKPDIKKIPKTLRNRHHFFLRLPEEDRICAQKILLDESGIYTNATKVDELCAALKLQYEIRNAQKNRSKYKIFVLVGDFDCVLIGNESDLYDRIIDYFKTMLNIICVI